MIKIIREVLDQQALEQLRSKLAEADFSSGEETAHGLAKLAKNNLQLDKQNNAELLDELSQHLRNSRPLTRYTMAARLFPVKISRYTKGMAYGSHADSSFMGDMRTDYSMTLFINPPEAYDGGELVIETEVGETNIKLPAGDLVLYPSDRVHRVEPVTRGERLAAITWIESRVRDPLQRQALLDLKYSLQQVKELEQSEITQKLSVRLIKTICNLERMWMN